MSNDCKKNVLEPEVIVNDAFDDDVSSLSVEEDELSSPDESTMSSLTVEENDDDDNQLLLALFLFQLQCQRQEQSPFMMFMCMSLVLMMASNRRSLPDEFRESLLRMMNQQLANQKLEMKRQRAKQERKKSERKAADETKGKKRKMAD